MTGHGDEELVRHGISEPWAGVLRKPFSPAEFARRAAELARPGAVFLGAFADGRMVGCGGYVRCDGYGEMKRLFVRPDARGRGVGRAAIAWVRESVWGTGVRVRVEVLVGNPAGVAFWRAVGFRDYCVTLELGQL